MDDCTGTLHMTWIVSCYDLDPGCRKFVRPSRVGVASRDANATASRNERERTHPRAGNPHEVDGTGIGGKKLHQWAANIV